MSKKSFRTIDGAVWGAVNILLGALKSVPQEWAGLKEIGMGGKNYIPLQALALEAEKILVYNLFRNRGSRDRKQMKLGIRFVESSRRPRSYQGEVFAAISQQVVRLFGGFWGSQSLSSCKSFCLPRERGHNMAESFILGVMRSQEAIILHEVCTASGGLGDLALTKRLQILHHVEEESITDILVPPYNSSQIIEIKGVCKIGDIPFDKVAYKACEQDSNILHRYTSIDSNGEAHYAVAYSVKPCQALAALKNGKIASIQNSDSIVYAAASALLYRYRGQFHEEATCVPFGLMPRLEKLDLQALKVHSGRSIRSSERETTEIALDAKPLTLEFVE